MAVVALLRAFLAGFLMAGYRMAGPQLLPLGRPGSARRVSAWPPGSPAGPEVAETRGRPAPVIAAPAAGAAPTAAAHLPPPRGPGAAAHSRPAPATSTGRPARDGAAAGSSSPGSVWRTGRCAPGRTCGRTPATQARDPAASPGPGPPQPQHLRRASPGGDALDLHADDRAAHDRSGPAAAVAGVALLLGMQPRPGRHGHGAVLVVLADEGSGRGRPGGRVGAVGLGAVAARPPRAAGWPWWWVGVEAAVLSAAAPAPPREPRPGPR
jgi:hypothetical protein